MKSDVILQALRDLVEACSHVVDGVRDGDGGWFEDKVESAICSLKEAEAAHAAKPERKILDISAHGYTACVDSDGCAWMLLNFTDGSQEWRRLPALPQGELT